MNSKFQFFDIIDKNKRKIAKCVKKYKSKSSLMKTIIALFHKATYCMGFLLIIVSLCIYFEYISVNIADIDRTMIYDESLVLLYSKFSKQLNLSRINPSQTTKDKLFIPQNMLLRFRTKSVQYLFDYVISATKTLYTDEYASDPNYHHLKCIKAWSESKEIKYDLNTLQHAVQHFLETTNYSIYNQNIMNQYVEKRLITKETCDGLDALQGQYGAFATKYIPKNMCIGVYYGDEYLRQEFKAQYPNSNAKVWNYAVDIEYDIWALKGLNIEQNITVTVSGYQSASESEQNTHNFVNDARRSMSEVDPTAEDLYRKNIEYVCCSLDGILITFIISTSDIQPNEQLFTYYGVQ